MLERLYVGKVLYRRDPEEDAYLLDLPAVRHLRRVGELSLQAPVTFLVGENGTGKSTLLEAIAVAAGFNAEGGTRNFNFSTYASHSELHRCIALGKYNYPKDGFYLRAESFYNVASNIEALDNEFAFGPKVIGRYGGISMHEQSHGESFMAVVENGFRGHGLYVLDEPEAALSPMRLMKLLVLMDRLVEEDSQFIISTHSPILMAYPRAEILELSDAGVRTVGYRETEHFQTTLRFLQNPEKMLGYLLQDDE